MDITATSESYTFAQAVEDSSAIYSEAVEAVYKGPTLELDKSFQPLLDLIRNHKCSPGFKKFSSVAVKSLWETVPSGGSKMQNPAGFEVMSASFHSLLLSDTPGDMFKECVRLHMPTCEDEQVDLILPDLLMEMLQVILKKRYSSSIPTVAMTDVSLSETEEQVLRYVAGFVAYKLSKHFARYPANSVAKLCLSVIKSWQNNPSLPQEPKTFLDYTNQWIAEVNRGGLFNVKDEVFIVFRHIENTCKPLLDVSEIQKDINVKTTLSESIIASTDFNVAWDIATQDVANSTVKETLKSKIISIYVNIRCKSFSRAIMNLRKKSDKEISKTGEKSLRKKLAT